ncbi:hypothetical protein ASZ78_004087, partial [Callipepla squamata]
QCSQSCSLCFYSTVMAVWEDEIPLLTVCLQSILLLPSEQDMDISLYFKVGVKELQDPPSLQDRVWSCLPPTPFPFLLPFSIPPADPEGCGQNAAHAVFVYPTASIGEELHSIFHVSSARGARLWRAVSPLLPSPTLKIFWGEPGSRRAEQQLCFPQVLLLFTCSWSAVAWQRAVGHIWKLNSFTVALPPDQGWETSQEEEQEKLEEWEDDHEFSLSWTTNLIIVLVAMALHKIMQHLSYGPYVCLFFPELFMVLIFQMVSSRALTSLEATTVMKDPICPSTPTSAIRYYHRAHC